MASMPRASTEASAWKRKEYLDLVSAVNAESNTGVLLSGETGIGKSMIVRNLLESDDVRFSTIRLICSPALTSFSYGALAPLLSEAPTEFNDVAAIRDSLNAIDEQLVADEYANQMLIIVEEAQYIDSASAFVLGQMVRAGTVKLLVLSNEEHEDPLSLEALMSVARLKRIKIDPLTEVQVQEFCGSTLGMKISTGTAKIIHQATNGFHPLVLEYLNLAQRRDALTEAGGIQVLARHELVCDESAAEMIKSLGQRQGNGLRHLLEVLSLAGPLTLDNLRELRLLDSFQQYSTSLIRIDEGQVHLASSFYADAVRYSMPPRRNTALFKEISSALGDTALDDPNFTRWALAAGSPIEIGSLRKSVQLAIRRNQFELAIHLLDSAEESNDWYLTICRLQALFGLGRLNAASALVESIRGAANPELSTALSVAQRVLAWVQPIAMEFTATHHGVRSDGRDLRPSQRKAWPVFNGFADGLIIDVIRKARREYLSGDITDAMLRSEGAALGEEATLYPSGAYRLAKLVVYVRAAVAAAQYGKAMDAVDQFSILTAFEVHYLNGTLEALRALVRARSGRVGIARQHLDNAVAELAVNDPEGLYPLCSLVRRLIHTETSELDVNSNVAEQRQAFILNNVPLKGGRSTSNDAWWEVDWYEARMLRELQDNIPLAGTIERIQKDAPTEYVILRSSLHYYTWLYTIDEESRRRSASIVAQIDAPESCIVVHRQKRSLQLSPSEDIEQMEHCAQEFHENSDVVPALEIMTRIVLYWESQNDSRRRGFAVRESYKWLDELGEKPWGLVAQALGSSGLTARENEIVDLVRKGMSNKEIASVLTVSQRTVEGHLYRVFAKLGITQRHELRSNGKPKR